VLTRLGREAPAVNAGVEAFLDRAQQVRALCEVIEVPEGQHGFDARPPVDGACAAVHAAIEAVRIALTR
jgi:acetyl esterase/lipase